MNDSTGNCCQQPDQDQNKKDEGCCGGGSCASVISGCDWKGVFEQAKLIMLEPANAWTMIKESKKSIKNVFTSYLIPLAAVSVICQIVGHVLFGSGFGLIKGSAFTIVSMVVMLALFYVYAHILKLLAPHFNGAVDEEAAFSLVAYSATAGLIGSYLAIVPPLAVLGIAFTIYGFYLMYLGIPVMTTVSDKKIPFLIVSTIACMITGFVANLAIIGTLGLQLIGK